MAHTTSVNVRGQQVDVKYVDHGYEPDTNAHDIDWEFVDNTIYDPPLTDAEEEAIYLHIVQLKEYD